MRFTSILAFALVFTGFEKGSNNTAAPATDGAHGTSVICTIQASGSAYGLFPLTPAQGRDEGRDEGFFCVVYPALPSVSPARDGRIGAFPDRLYPFVLPSLMGLWTLHFGHPPLKRWVILYRPPGWEPPIPPKTIRDGGHPHAIC